MATSLTGTGNLLALAGAYAAALRESLGERLVSVVLFGSVARGEATATSDIDLLVVAEGLPRGRFARVDVLAPARDKVEAQRQALLAQGMMTDFTEIILTPEEAQRSRYLYLDMTEDAVLLYDRGGFFESVLERMRKRLAELGSRRLRMGKVRYWDLKPDFRPGDVIEL